MFKCRWETASSSPWIKVGSGSSRAAATVILLVAYAVTLAMRLASRVSAAADRRPDVHMILEVLITSIMPMVALMVAVQRQGAMHAKTLSLTSVFMGMLAGLTCTVHFVILTLSRQPEFAEQSWLPLVLSFKWPSVVYALDILGWDVFPTQCCSLPRSSGGVAWPHGSAC